MKRLLGAVLTVLSLAAVLAVVVWESQELTSPGPLHPTHAASPELRAAEGCARCHGGGDESMAQACNQCHEPIAVQLREGKGLHGALEAGTARDCRHCHRDHAGERVALITAGSFAAAGVADRDEYRHEHVDPFTLDGRHEALACTKCHARADAVVIHPGEPRYGGLAQACVACHEDPHQGALGDSCAFCHRQTHPFDDIPPNLSRLHPSHAAVRALQGRDGCAACHTKGDRTPASSCNRCHEPIRVQLESRTALHGALDPELAQDCRRCHREHTDGGVGLVADESFREAGVEQPNEYDHRFTRSFGLSGVHTALACRACHALADAPALADGQRRYLGLAQRCASCHEDPHAGSLGDACAACHGQRRPFAEAATFRHTESFPLAASHAGLTCTACHAKGTPFAVETERGAPPSRDRRCAECHGAAHGDAFLSAISRFERVSADDTCRLCHAPEHASFAAPGAQMTVPHHAATPFPLDAPHAELACATCHPGYAARDPLLAGPALRAQFAARFPGRDAERCAACHTDPHAGQFDRAGGAGRCTECHARTHFLPSEFDAVRHARTHFPLLGAHRAVACGQCHTEARGGRGAAKQWSPVPTACAQCHDDVHGGRFDGPAAPATVNGRAGCARCHDAQTFSGVTWTGAEHGSWTGHALDGAHARASCAACHGRTAKPDGQGRTLGRAATTCAACHTDPHAGQFQRAGVSDCTACHVGASAWTLPAFDHDAQTRFKLDSDHAKLTCRACHQPVASPPGAAVVRYRPLGRRCQDCHSAGGKRDGAKR